VTGATLRPQLAEIVDSFAESDRADRLELLLDYADSLPPVPEGMAGLEPVPECQTPLYLAVSVDEGRVRIVVDAPAEAPTTRAFGAIIVSGLDGASTDEVLATPSDFFAGMGLADVVSPLRLRGLVALLTRVKAAVVRQL
jgi:cysteine desulfuration protein SufE